ncbi:hypothetical protein CAMRE0001_0778 [Campylobacter rectus RM3267]|uniref:Uncharacterized protein n=1 Tax=Campylobacter rectus RM3267 TaxID=553218 RepID=B9CZT5_CAMRE|nr:hypothetical protein CAMRE0001_0778 [Campylobacter rectus RM3267]
MSAKKRQRAVKSKQINFRNLNKNSERKVAKLERAKFINFSKRKPFFS